MDHLDMTLWAIGLKIGATAIAIVVLAVVFVAMRRRDRQRQSRSDEVITRGKERDRKD